MYYIQMRLFGKIIVRLSAQLVSWVLAASALSRARCALPYISAYTYSYNLFL